MVTCHFDSLGVNEERANLCKVGGFHYLGRITLTRFKPDLNTFVELFKYLN